MKIEHHDIITPKVEKPEGEWKQNWYGLWRLQECYAPKAWQAFKDSEEEAHRYGVLGERELEVDIFLSILEEMKQANITFMELGAGYGDWCMAVNGVLRYGLVNTKVKKVTCYAVEAEPSHYAWLHYHFGEYGIKGEAIPYVISDKDGETEFAVDADPSSNYGQSQAFTGSLLSTAGNFLRRGMIKAPCIKLDTLVEQKRIRHIHYLDMDVQGNELRVIRGAFETINKGKIDYIKIGTHGEKYHKRISDILKYYYDLVVDIYPNSIGGVNGLKAQVQDGIQVYRRHGL